MANQAEIDLEKQFQDDLLKATALSLEQEVLDEYNRTKKYGVAYAQSAQQDAKNKYYAQLRRQHYARRDSTETSASSSSTTRYALSLPPPQNQQQPQRRFSEINNLPPATLLTDVERSKTPPADLINFASPTSKKPENSSFEKLIEDLQKLQATNPQTALVPLGPTAAAPMYPGYHTAAAAAPAPAAMYAGSAAAIQPPTQYGVTTAAGAAGMQLVPFTPTPQQQKVPLTNEELQKLYSMSQPTPHTAPVYGPRHHMGFMPPHMAAPTYYPQTPPLMAGTAGPYTAPANYPNPYGFQYNVITPNQVYYPTNMASTSLSASTSSMASSSAAAAAAAAANFNQHNHSVNSSDLSSSNSSFNQTHSNIVPSSMGPSNGQTNVRRQTPPARKPRVAGSDLIDLSHEDE